MISEKPREILWVPHFERPWFRNLNNVSGWNTEKKNSSRVYENSPFQNSDKKSGKIKKKKLPRVKNERILFYLQIRQLIISVPKIKNTCRVLLCKLGEKNSHVWLSIAVYKWSKRRNLQNRNFQKFFEQFFFPEFCGKKIIRSFLRRKNSHKQRFSVQKRRKRSEVAFEHLGIFRASLRLRYLDRIKPLRS